MESDLGQSTNARNLIRSKRLVFWDFDGVIKDSVIAKSIAFEELFLSYGRDLADRVREHHEAHAGVSRFEKIPIYLRWAGEPGTVGQVNEFCDRFARQVRQSVIDAAWVPGVREYLQEQYSRQYFVLLTATPQEEILQILNALEIGHCFREVHGAPRPKASAIGDVLQRFQYAHDQVLVVGDSEADFNAASANQVPFLLRRTPLTHDLQSRYRGASFDGLECSEGLGGV